MRRENMNITSKGQVTIPKEIRDKYGFLPHTKVSFVEENGRVVLGHGDDEERLKKIEDGLNRALGAASSDFMKGKSTDEIMHFLRGED